MVGVSYGWTGNNDRACRYVLYKQVYGMILKTYGKSALSYLLSELTKIWFWRVRCGNEPIVKARQAKREPIIGER